MKLVLSAAALAILSSSSIDAFAPSAIANAKAKSCTFTRGVALNALVPDDAQLERELDRQMSYKPGMADTDLARRFGNLAGREVKTVGEAFTDFTETLGQPINPLYRSTVTDIVGSTHLTVMDARFQKDSIWSLGLLTTMDVLLKNYPEKKIAREITSALIKSSGFDEIELRQEAEKLLSSLKGMSKEDVTVALRGEGDSILSTIAKAAKGDQYWMYSKFFGIGLIKVMEVVGVGMNAENSYPVMEEWVGKSMGKSVFTACSDSDQWFKVKSKLDMMETLMKEIEIREKKRMADRLEERAEAALRQAERAKEWELEEKKAEVKEEVLV